MPVRSRIAGKYLTALVPVRRQGGREIPDRACAREKAWTQWKFRSQVQQTDQEREGIGGEKAALGVASLPVPPSHGTLPQSNMPARTRTGSAPAKGSGNATGSFRKKAGRTLVFPRLYSHRPAPAVELSPTDDPTWHRHHAGRRGYGGRRTRPPPLSHELR